MKKIKATISRSPNIVKNDILQVNNANHSSSHLLISNFSECKYVSSASTRLLTQKTGRLAVAAEDAEEAAEEAANNAQQAVDGDGEDGADLVDDEDDIVDEAEADEAVDVATDGSLDVDVVLAALGAVRDTVVDLAAAEAEGAGETAQEVDDSVEEATDNITGADSVAVLVGVEEGNSIKDVLEVETGETTADVLEGEADAGVDVDELAAEERDLGVNLERSEEDNVEEAGLAVGVVGVVLDDLVGRGSAVGAELHLDIDKGRRRGLGPAAGDDLAGALAGLAIPGLARGARAGTGPGAVGHASRALEVAAGLEGGVIMDGEVAGSDGRSGVEEGVRGRDGSDHGGHGGEAENDLGEEHGEEE